MSAPKWSVGMQRLGPGMYVGRDGKSLHCDAVELCAELGVPPTRANQDIMERAFREKMAQLSPAAKFETFLNERSRRA